MHSELVLQSIRHRALHAANPQVLWSMWIATQPSPHPGRSSRSRSARKIRMVFPYSSRLLCQVFLGIVVSQPMSARLYKEQGQLCGHATCAVPESPMLRKDLLFGWVLCCCHLEVVFALFCFVLTENPHFCFALSHKLCRQPWSRGSIS